MHTMQPDWKRSRNIIRSGEVHDPPMRVQIFFPFLSLPVFLP